MSLKGKVAIVIQSLNNAIPLGRLAKPEEIARLVAFLAGDGASYLTATTIFADVELCRAALDSERGLTREDSGVIVNDD